MREGRVNQEELYRQYLYEQYKKEQSGRKTTPTAVVTKRLIGRWTRCS